MDERISNFLSKGFQETFYLKVEGIEGVFEKVEWHERDYLEQERRMVSCEVVGREQGARGRRDQVRA